MIIVDSKINSVTKPSILDACRSISVEAKLSVNATNIMLKHLRPWFPELPKDSRTLLYTPRITETISISGGDYLHFGLSGALDRALTGHDFDVNQTLSMQIAIDGISLFRSSRRQLWPILGRTVSPLSPVFTIGIYCGSSKPKNVGEFLTPLINDVNNAISNGVYSPSKEQMVTLSIDCIICDAPATSMGKMIKCHSGYNSCERCTIVGVTQDRK